MCEMMRDAVLAQMELLHRCVRWGGMLMRA